MSNEIAAVWARASTEPQQSLDSQAARSKVELEKRGYVVPPERILKIDWTSLDLLLACPPKIGPLKMRDSCKIRTGGSKGENEKVFGGAGFSYPQGS